MIGDRDLPRPETDWRLYHHDPGHAPRHVSPQSRGPGYLSPESFHSDAADMDNSGRYRSYKDSSGDQGEVLIMETFIMMIKKYLHVSLKQDMSKKNHILIK